MTDLATTVAAHLPDYTVCTPAQAPGTALVTGPDLDRAFARLGTDPALLVLRCYSNRELALVVVPAPADPPPPPAPRRPVAPPVPADPITRDLWGNVLLAAAYSGPERRARHRTALDHWFTWCLRGKALVWETEATPPPLTDADRAECRAILRGALHHSPSIRPNADGAESSEAQT